MLVLYFNTISMGLSDTRHAHPSHRHDSHRSLEICSFRSLEEYHAAEAASFKEVFRSIDQRPGPELS